MSRLLPMRLVKVLTTMVLLAGSVPAKANPFTRFLHSGRHLHHRHAGSHRQGDEKTNPSPSPGPVQPAATQPTPTEPPPTAPSGGAVPSSRMKKESNRRLPSGVPVKNKPGFLRSPYGQQETVIDVRGFPSGTEVKDPFTGKSFVTP